MRNCLEQTHQLYQQDRQQSFDRRVFTNDELVNSLLAINAAASPIMAHVKTPEAIAYNAGFVNALIAVAVAFNMSDEVKERLR